MYDLHCHSNRSDGKLTPTEVVERAWAQGVQTLALTDHDTVAGYQEALTAAQAVGLNLISGIEISCQWSGRGVHIVGLNFDVDHPELLSMVHLQSENRELRAQKISEKLSKLGLPGAYEGARRIAGDAVVGRPHFAQFMIEQGFVKSMDGAFKRYLGTGKPGDVKQMWPVMGEAIASIEAAGGVAVLAHPDKYKVTRTRLRLMMKDFADAGGAAMEVISGQQDSLVSKEMARMADQFGLRASVGSDFHFPGPGWQELGRCPALPEGCDPVWDHWG